MMLRWLFMFLLLGNAVLLLWYSGFQEHKRVAAENPQPSGVQTLRLVAELDERLISKAEPEKAAITECLLFQGFKTAVSAAAVVEFVVEQGFDAEVEQASRKVVSHYTLNVATPEELERSMLLLDELEARGWQVTEDEILAGGNISVGRFSTQAEAERTALALGARQYKVSIAPTERVEDYYIVAVFQSVDQKLSKEIKEVVLESYSDIKIAKKVCSGVARVSRTE